MLYNVLSPLVVGIDADTFSEAAKKFVTMQRNLDITRLILADRFNNAMRADVAYRVKDGNVVAGISIMPTVYPSANMAYPAVATTSPTMPYPAVGMVGRPAAFTQTTSDGQQVFPINNNVAVGGVDANIGIGMGYAPTLAHGYAPGYAPGYFANINNKNLKK